MKKHSIYILLATSVLIWNCKPDQQDELTPSNLNPSGARVAAVGTPIKQWDATVGGSGRDQFSAIATYTSILPFSTPSFVLAGYSNSPITSDKPNAYGDHDYVISLVDATGKRAGGTMAIGGSANDELASVISTTDGGLLLGGWSGSPISGSKSQACKGSVDFWIVKVSAGGSKKWDVAIGGTGDDVLTSMVQTADGGYLLAGNSNSPVSGDKSQGCKGAYDFWIVKVDANGKKQWDKTFGGPNYDYLQAVVATPDGGFLMGGYSYSTNNYCLIKVDANGNQQWGKSIGNAVSSVDAPTFSLAKTTDGGFLVGGISYLPGDSNADYWVAKLDASGNQKWDKLIGGTDKDILYTVLASADGGCVLGGYSQSSVGRDKTEAGKGGQDFWVVKLDANGTQQWDKTLGGPDHDWFQSMVATTDGGYLLGGTSYSGIGGDKTGKALGGKDFWVVKIK